MTIGTVKVFVASSAPVASWTSTATVENTQAGDGPLPIAGKFPSVTPDGLSRFQSSISPPSNPGQSASGGALTVNCAWLAVGRPFTCSVRLETVVIVTGIVADAPPAPVTVTVPLPAA